MVTQRQERKLAPRRKPAVCRFRSDRAHQSRGIGSWRYLIVALVLLSGSFAIILFPNLDAMIDPWFILPDFAIELLVGLWLLIKGADVASSIVVHSKG